MTENVVSITGVHIGDQWVRKTGSTVKIDPRGEDVSIWWTAEGPRGHGYSAQPYARSHYGGSFPADFVGWDIEVWMRSNGASTGALRRVHRASVPKSQFSYTFSEEENARCAARMGLDFQALLTFVVWPVTARGRGAQGTVTTTVGTGAGRPLGAPRRRSRKWFDGGVLVQPAGRDTVGQQNRHGVSGQTSAFEQWINYAGTVLAYVDTDGKWVGPSIQITGLTIKRVPFASTGGLLTDSSTFYYDVAGHFLVVDSALTGSLVGYAIWANATAWGSNPLHYSVLATDAGATIVNVASGQHLMLAFDGGTGAGGGSSHTAFAFTQYTMRFYEGTPGGTNYIAIQAPASLSSDLTLTLPSADGTSGQRLVTNGSGVLSFATPQVTHHWWKDATEFRLLAAAGTFANTNPSISYNTDYTAVYSWYNLANGATTRVFLRTNVPADIAGTTLGIKLYYAVGATVTADPAAVICNVFMRIWNPGTVATDASYEFEVTDSSRTILTAEKTSQTLIEHDIGTVITSDSIVSLAGMPMSIIVTRQSGDTAGQAMRFIGINLYGSRST